MDSAGEADFMYLLSMWSARLWRGHLISWSVPKRNKCLWGGLKCKKLLLVHQGVICSFRVLPGMVGDIFTALS